MPGAFSFLGLLVLDVHGLLFVLLTGLFLIFGILIWVFVLRSLVSLALALLFILQPVELGTVLEKEKEITLYTVCSSLSGLLQVKRARDNFF